MTETIPQITPEMLWSKFYGGTSTFHPFDHSFVSGVYLTDGCAFIRDELEARWLLDEIINYQPELQMLGRLHRQYWSIEHEEDNESWSLYLDKQSLMQSFRTCKVNLPTSLSGLTIGVAESFIGLDNEPVVIVTPDPFGRPIPPTKSALIMFLPCED
jgi:hypothetical protein